MVDGHLSRMLIGADVSNVEGLWDQMYRASLPYGRKGLALFAISAIDIALWDNLARAAGKPVFELLGGPVRSSIRWGQKRLLKKPAPMLLKATRR